MVAQIRRLSLVPVVIVLVGSLGLVAQPADAKGKKGNHCVNPAGVDLNEFFNTNDAFITPFCTTAHTGDKWRPIVRWLVSDTHAVIPEDYVPARPTPAEDFLSKFVSARYAIDADTRRERTYTFTADELMITFVGLPDETQFILFTPRLRPLPPGEHTIDIFITMTADHWDGTGLDPSSNFAPVGESPSPSVEFEVIKARSRG